MRRLADAITASKHWGSIRTVDAWLQHDAKPSLLIRLTGLTAGDLLVPSFAALDDETPVQIQAEAAGEILVLPAIPGHQDTPLAPERSWARASIDCLEILREVPELSIRFRWPSATPPERFLATVSNRPAVLPQRNESIRAVTPVSCASFSQMTLPADVAQRCCSPVSLAMALMPTRPILDVAELVAECRHPGSGLYGVWPMATRAASRRGELMSVEACTSFEPMARALDQGRAVIASIRFDEGELTGAPLAKTSGHLVAVRGFENGCVVTHDPAAPSHEAVSRRYPYAEFARAWLDRRGVAYFFAEGTS